MDLAERDVVKVALNHWLRGGEIGRIIDVEENRHTHPYLVEFARRFPGGGIDGCRIYFDAHSISRVETKPGRSRRIQTHAPLPGNG